jgi:signal transduction histidine kinase
VEIFGYDVAFKAANARAPAFPEDLRRALQAGEPFAARNEVVPDGRILWVALATEHLDGPCAMLLARRIDLGPREDATTPLLWSIALAVGLGAAVLAAAGPAVRRIRRLTQEVSRSAAEGYSGTVTVSGADEIADLAVAFNEAGAAIRARVASVEEREKALREFVANTTHDVMVPLTVLQGHLAQLRDAPDATAVKEALEEAHYIGSLLHNLGAAARLEAGNGELHRSPVDLGALVERVVARHRPLARARDVVLDYSLPESPVTVEADLTLLEQAVGNLAHNAIRYNGPGGHVAVRLDRDLARPGTWSLRVLDDGPGILPDEIARLTERSYRGGAARTRHPEGQGLGLHIALEVAKRHGFTLNLHPREPRGLEAELSGTG